MAPKCRAIDPSARTNVESCPDRCLPHDSVPARRHTTMYDGGAPRFAWAIRDSAVMGGVYFRLCQSDASTSSVRKIVTPPLAKVCTSATAASISGEPSAAWRSAAESNSRRAL